MKLSKKCITSSYSLLHHLHIPPELCSYKLTLIRGWKLGIKFSILSVFEGKFSILSFSPESFSFSGFLPIQSNSQFSVFHLKNDSYINYPQFQSVFIRDSPNSPNGFNQQKIFLRIGMKLNKSRTK